MHGRRSHLRPLTLVALAILVAACGAGDEVSDTTATSETTAATEASATTETTAATETSATSEAAADGETTVVSETTAATETTAASGATAADGTSGDAAPASDAEDDLVYDLGQIADVEGAEPSLVLVFDRYQFLDGSAGPDLETEPSIAGASDLGYRNDETTLRRYPVAADAEVLAVDGSWLESTCAGANSGPAEYVDADLTTLAAGGAIVSLTFDDAGHVVTIRDQAGC